VEQPVHQLNSELRLIVVILVAVIVAAGVVASAAIGGELTTARAIILLIVWLALTAAGGLTISGIIAARAIQPLRAAISDKIAYEKEVKNKAASFATLSEDLGARCADISDFAGETAGFTATVKNALDEHLASVNRLVIGMGGWQENLRQMLNDVQIRKQNLSDLMRRVEQLMDVTGTLERLTSDAKLIAFNATIEAAGAGEAGVRFETVARELRATSVNLTTGIGQLKQQLAELHVSAGRIEDICISEQKQMIQFDEAVTGTENLLSAMRNETSVGSSLSEKMTPMANRMGAAASGLSEALVRLQEQLSKFTTAQA
jgi:methyl-accepting chemotaxis protein